MKRKKKNKKYTRVEFLHSGSYLLNLAGSGLAKLGGWARGRIANIVGDGSSGKTLVALELCAWCFYFLKKQEATKLFPKVKTLEIVYDNVEGVMDFPLEQMYGRKFVKAINWRQSKSVEEFGKVFQNKVKALKKGECLIYVLDSLDALPSRVTIARVEKELAKKKDTKEKGTYGMEKQKYLSSAFFNTLCGYIKGKDATLIIVSQVRDKINAGMFEEKQYRAGGKGLDFYTHQVCWLAVVKKLSEEVRGRKKVYGVRIRARFKRNKVAKPFRDAEFDILFNYGFDDIGSMINWMGYDKGYDKNNLKYYEDNPEELIEAVEEQWNEDEKKAEPERKRRFGL